MYSHLGDVNIEDAISQLFLAALLCRKGRISRTLWSRIVYTIIDLRNWRHIDCAPYFFRKRLHSAVLHINPFPRTMYFDTETLRYYLSRFLDFGASPHYVAALLGDHEYVS